MTTPLLQPSVKPAPAPASTWHAPSRMAAVATGLSLVSTLAYFVCSDGIHNYLALLGKACAALAKRLS